MADLAPTKTDRCKQRLKNLFIQNENVDIVKVNIHDIC